MGRPKKNKDDEPKVEPTENRAEKIGNVIRGAKTRYKRSVFHSPVEGEARVVPRASTGVFGMDLATYGGFPLGRVTMLYGPRSGGKTTGFIRGMGKAQRLCANCYQPGEFEDGVIQITDLKTGNLKEIETKVIVSCPCGKPKDFIPMWLDAEHTWNSDWAQRNGAWPEKILLVYPEYGEQGYDVAISMVNTGEISLIVIDSIAALTPLAEIESSMEQQHQGVAARVNNKFLRKIVSSMNLCLNRDGRTPTIWLINQVREKIGVMYGNPQVLPGGKGQEFTTSLEIEVRPGKIEFDDETKEPMWGEFSFTVKKNKVGLSGGKGEYKIAFQETDLFKLGDVMEHEFVIAKAVELGIIEKPSQQMYGFKGESYRGVGQLVRYLGEHPDEYDFVRGEILKQRIM